MGATITVSQNAYDLDNDSLTYSWAIMGGWATIITSGQGTNRVTISAGVYLGRILSFNLILTVRDSEGHTIEKTFPFN